MEPSSTPMVHTTPFNWMPSTEILRRSGPSIGFILICLMTMIWALVTIVYAGHAAKRARLTHGQDGSQGLSEKTYYFKGASAGLLGFFRRKKPKVDEVEQIERDLEGVSTEISEFVEE